MTKDEFLEFHKKTCEYMIQTTQAKNADYTGGNLDPFFNFTRVEELGFACTEVGFLTRMTDKICRIGAFVRNGVLNVKEETVIDTLIDLANYCILMAGYITAKAHKIPAPTCKQKL